MFLWDWVNIWHLEINFKQAISIKIIGKFQSPEKDFWSSQIL